MNDEIKEMLELHIKNDIDLLPKNQKTVLDYITNLQQENDDLKGRLENAVADCNLRLQEFKDYKSRIEKAVEYIRQYDGCITGWYYSKEHKRFLAEDNVKDDLLNILNGRSDE